MAVITGAPSGIGAATARLFVEEGARVVIADILDAEGEALARELGSHARFQHTDATQEADVQKAVDLAAQTFGRLDFMFNNAGASRPSTRSRWRIMTRKSPCSSAACFWGSSTPAGT